MTRSAILVTGLKGGPGKSTFARGLVDHYRSHGVATAAYDGDSQTESLLQYYGTRDAAGRLDAVQDPLRGVRAFSVRDVKERDLLIDLLETDAQRAVIDLPGGSVDEIGAVVGTSETFFKAYEDAGLSPIVVIVISHVKASAASVAATISAFGTRPQYVVCKNLTYADANEFEVFDGIPQADGTRRFGRARQAIEAVDGAIIEMPKLNALTYGRLDQFSLPFTVAEDSALLSLSDRVRVNQWRKDFAASLAGTVLEQPEFQTMRRSA